MNVATVGAMPLLWAQQTEIGQGQWISWLLWLFVGFLGIFPGIVAYLVWAERKAAARFQDRIGPNRVGPLGLLQPIADALKLITKEDIVPRAADPWVHLAAPVLLFLSAFLVMAVIPFAITGPRLADGGYPALRPVDLPSGLLYLVAVSSMSSLGVFLAGWSSRNKYSLLGGMRAVAQLVSYEVPQVLATVPVILWTGSLSLVVIVNRQIDTSWFLFSPPGLLSFLLLTIANIAEVNRTPFDLPEAESEIIAGYHTEYSGMRFGLFFLAEYLGILGVSCLGTVLFLGGGSLPFTAFPMNMIGENWLSSILVTVFTATIFGLKVGGYIFFMFWVRATLPRIRVDRLMNFAWKVLIPLGIINILIAAIWYEIVLRAGYFDSKTLLYGWLATLPLVLAAGWLLVKLFGPDRPAPGTRPGGLPRPRPRVTIVGR